VRGKIDESNRGVTRVIHYILDELCPPTLRDRQEMEKMNMINRMQFTYSAYRDLLVLIRDNDYAFRSYHDYEDAPRCVILRHDIDASLSCAVKLAELEAEEGIRSTWFVLLRTEFYNPFSKSGLAALRHKERPRSL